MNLLPAIFFSLLVASIPNAAAQSSNAVPRAWWLAAVKPATQEAQVPATVTVVTNDTPASAAVHGEKEADFHFTFSGQYQRLFGGDYASLSGGRLGVELLEREHFSFNLFAWGGVVELERGSSAHDAAHSPVMLGWGIGARYYFTPRKTFLRPYVTASLGWVWMDWNYREDIPVGDGSVSSDSLQGVDGYVGAGLLVGSNKRINLFGELGAGGVAFYGTTRHDLNNEMFDDFGCVGVKAGLQIRF